MLTKIKRRDCLSQYQVFPLRNDGYEKDEDAYFYPEVFQSYILTLPSRSFKGHAKALGIELVKLTLEFQSDKLIFLGDTDVSWLYQDNVYKPAKKAQEYLAGKNVGKRFNGAIQVDMPDLPVFVIHLAWLTRCNAALPDFHFTDQQQNIIGSICKYGNLHLDVLNEQTGNIVKSFVKRSKFRYGDTNSCYNMFGKTSAIHGRQTVF